MQKWYYLVKGQKQGPVDQAHINSLESAGVITGMTPIRSEHSSEWVELRNSELAKQDTPCQTINAIGRLGRIYRDFRICLGLSMLLILPLAIRAILDMIHPADKGRHPGADLIRFAIESRFWLVILVLATLFIVVLLVLWGLLIYRTWSVIPRDQRKFRPAVAAILSATPLVSGVAGFWTVAGLGRALTRQERREAVVAQRPSLALSLSFCILALLTQALLIFIFPVVVVVFMIWAGVVRQFHDAAINILHQRLLE